jgi:hypothetical protein
MIPAAAEVPVETRQEFIGAARELVEMQVTGLEEVIIELQKRREAELLEEKEGPRELKREEFLKRQARDKAMTFETLLAHCGDMIAGYEAADWLSATRLAHLPETGTLSAAETARALVQPLVLVERWVREGRIPVNREGRVPIPDVVRIGARLSCYRLEARADVEKGLAQVLRPPPVGPYLMQTDLDGRLLRAGRYTRPQDEALRGDTRPAPSSDRRRLQCENRCIRS